MFHFNISNMRQLYCANIIVKNLFNTTNKPFPNASSSMLHSPSYRELSMFQPLPVIYLNLKTENMICFQKRFAGHSKWQNIKHTKESKDLQRSRLFSKITMSIRLALKDGSADPISNNKLAAALDLARKNNMPNATINNVIEKSQKSMINAKEHYIAFRGPDGLCLFICVFTDNIRRPKSFIGAVVKKYGFKEERQLGGVRHMFRERGLVVAAAKLQEKPVTIELAEDHAIEVGAEEVEIVDDMIQFWCAAMDIGQVRSGLLELGYDIESTDVVFIPSNPISLDEDKLDSFITCVNKVEDLEEVVKVHANVV
ncbi:probable transcriptional regulatory protein FMG_0893 [Hyalella azteca]|uniref:Probable transcriptional regulatory protein FMG_0893 n=1 Tax=Hyalella azteca TaxID=294128 RepID=A0A8B7PGP8_HYAAZ|nr:probable transcriptional regulatory protein FMG_0893 [Hyalella azteca]